MAVLLNLHHWWVECINIHRLCNTSEHRHSSCIIKVWHSGVRWQVWMNTFPSVCETFIKVIKAGIPAYSVRWTALHSVHPPQTYDSSFELWAPCVNKVVQHFGAAAAADWSSFCRTAHKAASGKGGHWTLLKVIALPKMGSLQSWN